LTSPIYILLTTFFSLFLSIKSLDASEIIENNQKIAKRVYAHLLINDPETALSEIRQALKLTQTSQSLQKALIQVLAKMGREKEMMLAWDEYVGSFPEAAANRDLIEIMAWGVIEKGAVSHSPLTKIMALLAALFSQDTKGINILYENMHSSNSLIRAISIQLAAHLRDYKLCCEMQKLLKEEKVWTVRLEVIKAVGKMKLLCAKSQLEDIIASDNNFVEEKMAAIEALVNMLDTADRQYILKLAKSERAGLRLLACQVVDHFNLKNAIDLILPLVDDSRAEVRAESLVTMGHLRISQYDGLLMSDIATRKLKDPHHTVAIAAAWLLTLNNPREGQQAFESFFNHEQREVRLLAAAALTATGKYGLPLTSDLFNQSKDLYVRLNLALGLVSQQIEIEGACHVLYEGLTKEKERWMWEENFHFQTLAPSKVKHKEEIPQYPEAINQSVRLDILNILAIMKYDKAQDAIKAFLNERTEGMTGMTIALLLKECDDEALDLVKNCLNDKDCKIRIQAALILALWGRDEAPLQVLQESYLSANREEKERILEGIGHVGAESSIPFLLGALKEEYQTLRLIAAAGLIQCINH
jgi:HEAT repeat protein